MTITDTTEELLTREQKARVFAMYFGANNEIINPETELRYRVTLYQLSSLRGFEHEYKLLLSDLASISDQDALELCCNLKHKRIIENPVVKHLEGGVSISNISGGVSFFWHDLKWYEREFLIMKGYAVPLFFSPDHPYNGKTAIELGIALDKMKPITQIK